jgi:predicted RNase H-like HicB family nuclease
MTKSAADSGIQSSGNSPRRATSLAARLSNETGNETGNDCGSRIEDAMLKEYIRAAMRHATYEILEDDGTFYGHIPECPGAWANEPTLEACREELESVLEDWILLGVHLHHPIPTIDGIDINLKAEPVETV